jgi:hypothetical protein
MISPLIAGLRDAEIHPAATFNKKAAYSDASSRRKRSKRMHRSSKAGMQAARQLFEP